MEFEILSQESSTPQDNSNNLFDLLNKTKSQPTKFFTELNRHHRISSKKKVLPADNLKRNTVGKKRKKGIPTFKEMILTSKSNNQDDKQPQKNVQDSEIQSKKKFPLAAILKAKPQERRQRKRTSIQKSVAFNFDDTIKQMAVFLSVEKKNSPFVQHSSSSLQEEINDDLFTGYTEREFEDGIKFKGICENGVIVKGQLHFQNGFIYDGEIFLDKFHGKGKLTLPKGQTIEADWVEGDIVGKATIKYPKGQIFYGDVKNFRRHGQGYLFFNDGSKYQGEFHQGELTGYGVHITVDNEKTEGYWFYGDFIGTDEEVFESLLNNTAAHEKKRSQKKHKNIKFSKTKSSSSRNSQNLFADLLLNLDKLTIMTKTDSVQEPEKTQQTQQEQIQKD